MEANKESGVPADLLCLLHPDMVKYRREQTAVRAVEDQREGRRILAKAFGSIEKAREHFAAQGLAVQGI